MHSAVVYNVNAQLARFSRGGAGVNVLPSRCLWSMCSHKSICRVSWVRSGCCGRVFCFSLVGDILAYLQRVRCTSLLGLLRLHAQWSGPWQLGLQMIRNNNNNLARRGARLSQLLQSPRSGPNCPGYSNPFWVDFTSACPGPKCLSYFQPLWVDFASFCPVTLERIFRT